MDESTVEEIKRHFGIVAEDLRSDIRAVAEGQDLLREQFDGLRGELGGLRRDFDRDFDGLRAEVGGLHGEVNGLRGDFEAFRQQTVAEFQEIKSMIRLSYAEIDRRFQVLEADVSALRQRVERIEARG